jgi:hypothetical protein
MEIHSAISVLRLFEVWTFIFYYKRLLEYIEMLHPVSKYVVFLIEI